MTGPGRATGGGRRPTARARWGVRGFVAGLLSLALGLTSVVSSSADAVDQVDEPTVEYLGPDVRLWQGPWTGFLFAGGTGTASVQGLELQYTLEMDGSLALDVPLDDGPTGTFELVGEHHLDAETAGGQLTGEFTDEGSGSVDGTASQPSFAGDVATTGTIVVSAGGGTQEVPASSEASIEFDVVLGAAICNEVYGSFEADLEARLRDVGWTPAMEGNAIFLQDPQIVATALDEWYRGFTGGFRDLETATDFPPGTPDIVRALDELNRRYNSLGDLIDASGRDLSDEEVWATTRSVLTDSEWLLRRLRTLSPCEVEMLGPLRDKFVTLLTLQVYNLIKEVAERRTPLSGSQFATLTQMALNAGAFGNGSLFPARAAEVEDALRDAAVRILEPWVLLDDPDCDDACIAMAPDVVAVLTICAQLGWVLRVKDHGVTPSALLALLGRPVGNEDLIPLLQR